MQQTTTVRIGVLGPLDVTVDGSSRPVPGRRLRALLTRFAVGPGRAIPASELIEAVWGDDPPNEAANALQSLVSRLRRALGQPGLIVAEPGGYRLLVPAEAVDLHVFSRLVEDAKRQQRNGNRSAAHRAATDALDRWRSEPLPDARDADYATAEVASLEGRRLDAVGIKIESDLQRGDTAEVTGELERLVTEHPLRETFTGQLIRALAGAGRTGEALAAYERCRDYLADQLGADPGPALQRLHLQLLRGELGGVDPDHGGVNPPHADTGTQAGNKPEDASNQHTARGQVQEAAPAQQAGTVQRPNVSSRGTNPKRRDNLRRGLTSFVGRGTELDQLAASVAGSRLTTLIGTGGAGKTRTATEAALRWLDDGGSAAWMIELAPILSGENIPGAMLGVLGDRDPSLNERADRVRTDEMQQVLDLLADADCLLIFDNCEHLVDGVAKTITEILAAAPDVRVLATSREPLSVAGKPCANSHRCRCHHRTAPAIGRRSTPPCDYGWIVPTRSRPTSP